MDAGWEFPVGCSIQKRASVCHKPANPESPLKLCFGSSGSGKHIACFRNPIVQARACLHPEPKEIMRKAKNGLQDQAQLAFPEKLLWDKLPADQKLRCRELLQQMLRNVVLAPPIERKPDE